MIYFFFSQPSVFFPLCCFCTDVFKWVQDVLCSRISTMWSVGGDNASGRREDNVCRNQFCDIKTGVFADYYEIGSIFHGFASLHIHIYLRRCTNEDIFKEMLYGWGVLLVVRSEKRNRQHRRSQTSVLIGVCEHFEPCSGIPALQEKLRGRPPVKDQPLPCGIDTHAPHTQRLERHPRLGAVLCVSVLCAWHFNQFTAKTHSIFVCHCEP